MILCWKYKCRFAKSHIYIFYSRTMHNRNSHLLIANIRPTIHAITPEVIKVFEENNYDKRYITACIDWCINEALFNVLLLSVVNIPKCQIFEIVYSRISFILETHIRSSISFRDVSVFKENSVKTICNGQDLYITTYHDFSI